MSKNPKSVIRETKLRRESEEVWKSEVRVLEAMNENLKVGLLQLSKALAMFQNSEEFTLHI